MKRITCLLLLSSMLLFSCNKNSEANIVLDGTYAGTFTRVGMVLTEPVPVQIRFTGKSFTGESDKSRHPDICNGEFAITGDSVNFKNACVFPADFDWSLILEGKYRISSTGDSLTISRMYVGIIVYSDTYRLKKQ